MRIKMQNNRNRAIKIYLWFLTGLILASAISLMWMSRSADVNKLMNQQRIYDFSKEQLQNASAIKKLPAKKVWNYLRIDAEDAIKCRIVLYDKDQNILWKQQNTVSSGVNMLEITYGEPFKYISVETEGASIRKMQLRMNTILFQPREFCFGVALVFGIYLIVSIFFVRIKKKKRFLGETVGGTVLQNLYKDVGNYFGSRAYAVIKGKRVRVFRTICFFLLFLQGAIEEIGRYRSFLVIILLCIIAFLSWERTLEIPKWNNALVLGWILFALWMCVSDFVVSKQIKFIGYVFLTGFGLFYFVWSQMEKREKLLAELLVGFTAAILVMGLLCHTSVLAVNFCESGTKSMEDWMQTAEIYLRNCSLFGSESRGVLLRGEEICAPNGMLQIGYAYGLPVYVFYLLLLVSSAACAWKKKQGSLIIITVVYVFSACTLNVEQALKNPLWLLYYISLGYLFSKS